MTSTDEQRAKFEAHEKAQFKIWAESKFEHIAEHMRWVTISIAEEGWMARAALAPRRRAPAMADAQTLREIAEREEDRILSIALSAHGTAKACGLAASQEQRHV